MSSHRRFDHEQIRKVAAAKGPIAAARAVGCSPGYARLIASGQIGGDHDQKSTRKAPKPLFGRATQRIPAFDHPSISGARTLYPSTVYPVAGFRHAVLKSGHNSAKIGRRISKGRWKGFEVYTLTLRRGDELHLDPVLLDLTTEADGHHPVGVEAVDLLQQHRTAGPATKTLARDADEGLASLERQVPEIDGSFTVFDDVRRAACAGGRFRIGQVGVDVQNVAVLLNPFGPQAFKPQQIQLGDHVSPLNLKRRSHASAPVNDMLQVAA